MYPKYSGPIRMVLTLLKISPVLLFFQPSKNIDFHRSYDTFTDVQRIWEHKVHVCTNNKDIQGHLTDRPQDIWEEELI